MSVYSGQLRSGRPGTEGLRFGQGWRAAANAPRKMVVTFGEAVLTYKPAEDEGETAQLARPMLQAVGGAELNVAVALARAGGRAAWVSVLPTGPLGEVVISTARAAGVDTPTQLFKPAISDATDILLSARRRASRPSARAAPRGGCRARRRWPA